MVGDKVILDCQNINSTLQSIANYFRQPQKIIKKMLIHTNFDLLYEKNADKYEYFTDYIYHYFKTRFGDNSVDEVMWFHLTRTMHPENYYNGILSLNEILPHLQRDLYSIVNNRICKADWDSICEKGASGYRQWRYELKKKDKVHYGPYAMLVRDIAFCSDEVGNHNYLKIPEIIEDMCMGIEESYGFDLIEEFHQQSKPTIVKFREKIEDQNNMPDYVGTMLFYLYCSLNNQRLSLCCNTCYSGRGESINSRDIISVEVLNE